MNGPFDREDVDCITICQGLPRCSLTEDEAVIAIEAGCKFCLRVYHDPETGQEWEVKPGEA